ncbi:MAG: helix-turn-helix transcriptional regulator [Alcanivoracaceae bacterium]|nr:helix-turn-helix transcriptional regulator [Alcanivoracaceae bacterium]
MRFGDKIRAIRTKHKLSLAKLGKEIGVSKAAIWQWENVIVKPGNIKTGNMEALCRFLNVSKDYFLNDRLIYETEATYKSNKTPVFDDILTKTIIYVLDNTKALSHEDVAVAIRLLYNKVKDKKIILSSDLEEVLQLLC